MLTTVTVKGQPFFPTISMSQSKGHVYDNNNTCFHKCCFYYNSDSLSRHWCMQTSSHFHITRNISWKTILNYNQWKLMMEKSIFDILTYPINLIFTTLIRFFNYTIPKHLWLKTIKQSHTMAYSIFHHVDHTLQSCPCEPQPKWIHLI